MIELVVDGGVWIIFIRVIDLMVFCLEDMDDVGDYLLIINLLCFWLVFWYEGFN